MKKHVTVLKNTLAIGLEKPLRILHITDTHLTRADPSGWNRTESFDQVFPGCKEQYYLEALAYAKENGLFILHTGDILDLVTEENLAFVKETLSPLPHVYAAGNHDFAVSFHEKEDDTYKWQHFHHLSPYVASNLYFSSCIVGGVNLVTLDNTYYQFTEGQLDCLKAEVARGYPIILAMHIPIHEYGQAKAKIAEEWSQGCSWMIGTPEDELATYKENLRVSQSPNEVTRRVIDYIKSTPAIRAVIAGHTHANYETMLTDTLPQYTTHGSFAGFVREIEIV